MKILLKLKTSDYIFAVILIVFGVACFLLGAPLMMSEQRDVFIGFFLMYNFLITLILVYRENRKNLK